VTRNFTATRPNQLWVIDLTYVTTWRGFADVEFATLEWVWWFNHQRLLEPLGYVPPAEFEEAFQSLHRDQQAQTPAIALT
jgi:transposase InsO family protein